MVLRVETSYRPGCSCRSEPERGRQAVCPGAAPGWPGELAAAGCSCRRPGRASSAGRGLPPARRRRARARLSVSLKVQDIFGVYNLHSAVIETDDQ